jgi:hypothetical protein
MGQITNPIVAGISVLPTDRQSGPLAGGGATGNNDIFLGQLAGQNSTISNFIAIGHHAGDGGITDAVNLNGTTIVGANSLTSLTTGAGTALPITALGSNIAPALVNGDSTVMVGSAILTDFTGTGGTAAVNTSVLIGNKLLPVSVGNSGAVSSTVMIGYSIASAAGGFADTTTSVFIGTNILQGLGNNAAISSSIMIGPNVGGSITGSSTGNILIGISTNTTSQGANNINIGGTASQSGAGGAADAYNICLGVAAVSLGNLNTLLGAGAKSSTLVGNVGNVCIGANAGTSFDGSKTNLLVIEASTTTGGGTGNAPSALIYGSFASGNILFGNSATANRTFGGTPGTNMVGILNGTQATVTPVANGGYFSVLGGVLSWIDQNSIATQLSNTTSGHLIDSAATAFLNNAGAQIATTTNGPTAGNPTKWIPINDNGTIRNIPAW